MKRLTMIVALSALSLFSCVRSEARAEALNGSAIKAKEAKALLDKGGAVLLDVRTKEEFAEGRIPGALLLPYDEIDAETAAAAIPSKSTEVIVYCRSGRRSAIAAKALMDLGYERVRDLGGINAWTYGVEK